jgi:hypothetical protein
MKKLLLLVMLTSMFGTAHATRSRMNSLGQDPNLGSFYLMDNRNFFRNPANAAKMRNYMVAELGQNYAAPGATPTEANFEGGYFSEFNSDLAFGVYLGKQAVVSDIGANFISALYTPVVGTDTASFMTSADANPLNLFLAGGADLKWGINLNYAATDREIEGGKQKYDALGLSLGIETSGGLQVYASYSTQKSDGAATGTDFIEDSGELENTGYYVGVIYNLNAETTIFGQYNDGEFEQKATGSKADLTGFIVGIGRIYELSPTARFNFDLSYNMGEADAGGGNKIERTALPLTIGLETDASEWLILRASINQNFILGEVKNTTPAGTLSDSSALTRTNVALGGTLHFGKLKIDGNLGGFGGESNTSLFDATSFFVNAAATYMF